MEGGQTRVPPPSYLGWSYFTALFCCLPLGAAAIRYSKKVKAANERGELALAEDASQTAKALNIAAVVFGIAFITIFVTCKVYEINGIK